MRPIRFPDLKFLKGERKLGGYKLFLGNAYRGFLSAEKSGANR